MADKQSDDRTQLTQQLQEKEELSALKSYSKLKQSGVLIYAISPKCSELGYLLSEPTKSKVLEYFFHSVFSRLPTKPVARAESSDSAISRNSTVSVTSLNSNLSDSPSSFLYSNLPAPPIANNKNSKNILRQAQNCNLGPVSSAGDLVRLFELVQLPVGCPYITNSGLQLIKLCEELVIIKPTFEREIWMSPLDHATFEDADHFSIISARHSFFEEEKKALQEKTNDFVCDDLELLNSPIYLLQEGFLLEHQKTKFQLKIYHLREIPLRELYLTKQRNRLIRSSETQIRVEGRVVDIPFF